MSYLTNKDLKLLTKFYKKNMKIKTLIDSIEGLNVIQKEKLPMVLSLKISKLIKSVAGEVEIYDKVKFEKVKELGEEKLTEDGKGTGKYDIKKENTDLFKEEYEKLINHEVNIEIPEINSNEFVDKDGKPISIEPWVLVNLGWLIK